MSICQDKTRELDCGENRIIHIEEGTNYGHLWAFWGIYCTDNTATGSNQNAANNANGGNAATTTTELPAAAEANTTTALPAAAENTTAIGPTTTGVPYVKCMAEDSKKKVEDL